MLYVDRGHPCQERTKYAFEPFLAEDKKQQKSLFLSLGKASYATYFSQVYIVRYKIRLSEKTFDSQSGITTFRVILSWAMPDRPVSGQL